jgi:hypothetical protein
MDPDNRLTDDAAPRHPGRVFEKTGVLAAGTIAASSTVKVTAPPEPRTARAPRRAPIVRVRAPRRVNGSSGRPRVASSRLVSTRAGPSDDPDESEPPGLALWRHSKYGLVNRLLAAFLDRRELVE